MSHNEEQYDRNDRDDSNDDQQEQRPKSRKRGGKLVDYTLTAMGKTKATFSINYQDKAVNDFLGANGGEWRASNGVNITLGLNLPEWKLSEDEIRLNGGDDEAVKHVDTTAFPETPAEFKNRNNRQYQRNAMRRFDEAMEEFEEVVKEWIGEEAYSTNEGIIRV